MTTKEDVIKGMTQDIWEREKNIKYSEAETKVRHNLRYWNEGDDAQ